MIDNWPYAIVGELLARYGESPTDLSRFLTDTVGIPKDDVVRAKKIKTILDYFQDEGHLTWKTARWTKLANGTENWDWENKEIYKELFGYEANGDKGTLGNTRVEAHLTFKGLEFATNIVRNEQLHNSQVDTNFYMKWLTIILASAAVLTLIAQGWQCNISRKQLNLQESESSKQSVSSRKCLTTDTATLDTAHSKNTYNVSHSSTTSLNDTAKSKAGTTSAKPKVTVKP